MNERPQVATFCECERRLAGSCARCGGPACPKCDFCHGCARVICFPCNTTPTPDFAFPGDVSPHPHVEV